MKILFNEHNFIKKIPTLCGVYKFFDSNNWLLYVGKAINLRNRIKSYTKVNNNSSRIALMITKIHHLEIIITNNEHEALTLENNLIKTLKPKYNIIFRDDKTYPFIYLSNHKFPRLGSYRYKHHQANLKEIIFGPYANVELMKVNLNTLQHIFKLRTCTDNVFKNRTRPCMLYQINRCSAPCVNYIDKVQYQLDVHEAKLFLQGNMKHILIKLQHNMDITIKNMNFELAANIRDQMNQIKQQPDNQMINNDISLNVDIVHYIIKCNTIFVYIIMIRNGQHSGDNHFTININNDNIVYLFENFIENYYFNYLQKMNLKLNYILLTKDIYKALTNDFRHFCMHGLFLKIKSTFSPQLQKLLTTGIINLQNIIMQHIST